MSIDENILKWYPFKDGESVLEIYKENYIIEKLEKNLNVDKCNIEDLKIEGEYDYITLIGTFEYASKIISEENSYISFLEILKQHLKQNGKILIAIDNRLGVKYLAGNKYKNYNRIFDGISNKIRKDKPNLLLKEEIEKFIKEAGFNEYKFYYPLPDYRFVNTIFTDKYLPGSNNSKIIYPLNYDDDSIIIYNEINLIKQLCDIGQFPNFTNSYFVEIANNRIENDIKFVNYNIFRKDKYKLMLIMKEKKVEKIIDTSEGKEQINRIKDNINNLTNLGFNVLEKAEDDKIVEEFIEVDELDKKIIRYIKNGNIDAVYEEIEKWYNYIEKRLRKLENIENTIFSKYNINVSKEVIDKLSFVKDGYIDLSFENVFCKDEYLFYDQEWFYENVPLEFILYRAINNLYTYNENELNEKLEKQKLFRKFKLDEHIKIFEELEEKIQYEIIDKDKVEKYRENINAKIKDIQLEIEKEEQLEKQLIINQEELKRKQSELLETIEQFNILKDQKTKIETEHSLLLQEYNTSRGWKIIKGFRKIMKRSKDEPKT